MGKAEKVNFLKKQRDDAIIAAGYYLEFDLDESADSYALDAMKLHKIVCDLENGGKK